MPSADPSRMPQYIGCGISLRETPHFYVRTVDKAFVLASVLIQVSTPRPIFLEDSFLITQSVPLFDNQMIPCRCAGVGFEPRHSASCAHTPRPVTYWPAHAQMCNWLSRCIVCAASRLPSASRQSRSVAESWFGLFCPRTWISQRLAASGQESHEKSISERK